ncbi:hypothetical protein D9615_004456 [Tricholomella constricta]|uniref:Uncharacterized protein n=1 Tax=Tricholomella constricta TaxID=117010 RepID=A0A8H5M5Z9_9AGAR|nr:hypothetical protein D9615_004456 [Tricholomella constricta]
MDWLSTSFPPRAPPSVLITPSTPSSSLKMFSTLFTIALLAAPAFADFTVSTPTLTQCKDVKISWQATKGPYNIIAVPSENPCGDALADLGDHTGTSIVWKAALPAGTKVQLSVEDADGDEAWSGSITVQKSDDASCIPADLVKPDSDSKPNNLVPSSVAGSGSTVVVTPTTTVQAVVPQTTGAAPSAVGAAGNAGANPLGIGNGALTMRQASTPVMVLGALAAVLAISL